MPLIHLMYASRLDPALASRDAMTRLLEDARAFNDAHQVTGGLRVNDAAAFQVLEGDPDTVDALYRRIEADARHRDVKLMMRERLVRRQFARWSMGEAHADAATLGEVAALEAFLADEVTTADLGAPQAHALIEALRRNRHWWR
ncbi:hypothetical protein BH09PSE6_BH09PSE6_04700 [soil metagenome]